MSSLGYLEDIYRMNCVVFSNLNQSRMIKCSSLLILLLHFFGTCHANCATSCGIIRNISSPFRLKGDPKKCGDRKFELTCKNNVTSIYFVSHKYYVKAINYDNSTIRLVDASVNYDDICSFPTVSAYAYNFTHTSPHQYPYVYSSNFSHLTFMRCPHLLKNSSLSSEITAKCTSNARYTYIKVGRMTASEVTEMCRVEAVVMTSWEFKDSNNVSLSEIHDSLLYGFELTICPKCITFKIWDRFTVFFYNSILPLLGVIVGLLLAAVIPSVVTVIGGFFALSIFLYLNVIRIYFMSGDEFIRDDFSRTALISAIIISAPRFIIFPLAVWLFIYKFRRRHLSLFEGIESFLQSDNKLTPIRYSYSDIKKMTKSFQDKLGEGGYGSVYKGKLQSGHHVAVKLLRKSGGNGQDFINEIATIGRIHHVNVVKLVGYCAQGSKRALVFDFMPNGSLEKYLSNRGKMIPLNWDTKFEIAVGIAQGIEYLHRGCDIQILHFDIKPHNILLDDNFIPKISDFGLAKICSTDKKSVTMTAVRGTIGYVAPELISRSIGAVSYKADVYSFGMLLMEMLGLNRDLKGSNTDSEDQYFPYWIYECFEQGKDVEIGQTNENTEDSDDNDSRKSVVRKMTIVGLWCIQMNPDDRPSMNKVLRMLEGDVERLQIPKCPSQSTQIEMNVDESGITCWSDSEILLNHDNASSSVEITVQE